MGEVNTSPIGLASCLTTNHRMVDDANTSHARPFATHLYLATSCFLHETVLLISATLKIDSNYQNRTQTPGFAWHA
ncbi:MAG: hypothetical protein H6R04_1919 [Burkholderiaceae bacterium]|nr:hypothetical protein [Burkholderiaceae bacterium]